MENRTTIELMANVILTQRYLKAFNLLVMVSLIYQ